LDETEMSNLPMGFANHFQSQVHGTTLTPDGAITMVRNQDGAQRNPGIGTGVMIRFPRNALRSFRTTYCAFVLVQAPYFLSIAIDGAPVRR
jgi:hypothetical protein